MNKFTNITNIPLSLCVWLIVDDYDHCDDPFTISTTSLLKPLRSIVLARQNKDLIKIADASALSASSIGTAIHDSIERTWLNKAKMNTALLDLGYTIKLIKRILVNPKPEDIQEDSICIYMEKRSSKKVGKYTVSGKFDFVIAGALEDFKSTSTYSYISGSNIETHRMQGSIYRWLNQDIITNDVMSVQYIFTDWKAMEAVRNPKYPRTKILESKLVLNSIEATSNFVETIINKIDSLMDKDQSQLPLCTDEELWRKPDVFKYYKNPTKRDRSTKNFDNYGDAAKRAAADGNVGTIATVKGTIMRCKFCNVVGICNQAMQLEADGLLVL